MKRVGVDGCARREQVALKIKFGVEGSEGRCCTQGIFQVGTADLARLQLGEAVRERRPLAHGHGHATKHGVEVVYGQAGKTGVTAMPGVHASSDVGIGRGNHLHGSSIDVADGVCPRTHRVGGTRVGGRRGMAGAHDAVFASAALAWGHAAGRLSAVSRASRGRRRLVQFLLVTKQQVAAGKASRALGALKRLFLCVRALMALQVLEAGEGALASRADMRARLVGLWGRKVGRSLGCGIDSNGRCRVVCVCRVAANAGGCGRVGHVGGARHPVARIIHYHGKPKPQKPPSARMSRAAVLSCETSETRGGMAVRAFGRAVSRGAGPSYRTGAR